MGRSEIPVVNIIHVLFIITASREECEPNMDVRDFSSRLCSKVFDFKELVSWCIDKFDKKRE
jgi:hypothetical protein